MLVTRAPTLQRLKGNSSFTLTSKLILDVPEYGGSLPLLTTQANSPSYSDRLPIEKSIPSDRKVKLFQDIPNTSTLT
ncbi:MAG: hypothetical protein P8Z35_08245 [Ignavibacteriaceae bacterium]